MTTKLNPTTDKRLRAVGIVVLTEEAARQRLLKVLTKNGIDGMEDEDTDTLIDIAESFVEENNDQGDTETGGDDEVSVEEQEAEALADEAEEQETAETKETDALDSMDRTRLKGFIKDNELAISVKKSMTDDDIRTLIRSKVAGADEAEEEEAEAAPAAQEPVKDVAAPKTKRGGAKRSTRLDPKNNKDDRAVFEPLKALFPESEFSYAWVASSGVSVKYKGANASRAIILIENCAAQPDGGIKCNLYLLTLGKQLDVLDAKDIDYKICWSGAPFVKGISLNEAVETVEGLLEHILPRVKKVDEKLGKNRKKMEEALKKTSKGVKSDDK